MRLNLFARFSRAKKEPQAGYAYAPGTKLSYDPELIPRFKGHHVTLLKLFGDLRESAHCHQITVASPQAPERLEANGLAIR